MRKILIIIFSLTAIFGCKKNRLIKDANVHGQIINLCTDKGFPNVEVLLKEVHKKRFNKYEYEELTTQTDVNGNFSFTKTIHYSDDYKYYLTVPSYSNRKTNFEGIGQTEIDKAKIIEPIIGKTTATFYRIFFKMNNIDSFHCPDSFFVDLNQRVLKKNLPNSVSHFTTGGNCKNITVARDTFGFNGEYKMGMWQIDIFKFKNGIATTYNDSIYLDMGDTQTYTIEW